MPVVDWNFVCVDLTVPGFRRERSGPINDYFSPINSRAERSERAERVEMNSVSSRERSEVITKLKNNCFGGNVVEIYVNIFNLKIMCFVHFSLAKETIRHKMDALSAPLSFLTDLHADF